MASVLPVPVPATMPKPRAAGAPASAQLGAACVRSRNGLDVEPDGEFDRLARRARRRDDDDATGGRLRRDERVVVGRQVAIVDGAHANRHKPTVPRALPLDQLHPLAVAEDFDAIHAGRPCRDRSTPAAAGCCWRRGRSRATGCRAPGPAAGRRTRWCPATAPLPRWARPWTTSTAACMRGSTCGYGCAAKAGRSSQRPSRSRSRQGGGPKRKSSHQPSPSRSRQRRGPASGRRRVAGEVARIGDLPGTEQQPALPHVGLETGRSPHRRISPGDDETGRDPCRSPIQLVVGDALGLPRLAPRGGVIIGTARGS